MIPIRTWSSDIQRWWRRWRHPTGLVVAVLGPDGVGKSTLIAALRAGVVGTVQCTAVFHWRPSLVGNRQGGPVIADPHGKPPHPRWLSPLKVGYYIGGYVLGYLCVVRPLLVRSTLVLFDRYYDDLLIDPRRYRYGGPTGLLRLGGHIVRRPDVYLILDAPEELVARRKHEVSRQEMTRQRTAYREFAAAHPAAVLLDSSRPVDTVARDAIEVVLSRLRTRYPAAAPFAHWSRPVPCSLIGLPPRR